MLLKILLTVAVILAAAMLLRQRQLGDDTTRDARPSQPRRYHHMLSAGLLLGLLLIGSGFFYLRWSEDQRLVAVRVVNSSTGVTATYQALAKSVQGRAFMTADGRQIRLADIERMEILAAEP